MVIEQYLTNLTDNANDNDRIFYMLQFIINLLKSLKVCLKRLRYN